MDALREVETNPTFTTDRERLAHLAGRRDALRRDLASATARVSTAEATRTAALTALAEGRGEQAGVEKADRTLTLARAGVEHLTAALRSIEVESIRVTERIQAAETARQEIEANGLRKEADALVERFVSNVAELLKPLEQRAALVADMRARLPLARQLEPIIIERLGHRLSERFRANPGDEGAVQVHLGRLLAGWPASLAVRPYISIERRRELYIEHGR